MVGLLFGIIDWYYLDLLQSFLNFVDGRINLFDASPIFQFLGIAVIVVLNWGFWLVPVFPVAFYESRRSDSIGLAALSAVVVWSLAVLSYYGYYIILLLFWGLPNLEFMLYSNRNSGTYWQDWTPLFQRLILNQLYEWIPIALVGGVLVGAFTNVILRLHKNRRRRQAGSRD